MIEQKLEVRKGSGSGESLTKVQAQIRVDRASCTNRQTFLPYFQCVIAGLVRVHLAPPYKEQQDEGSVLHCPHLRLGSTLSLWKRDYSVIPSSFSASA